MSKKERRNIVLFLIEGNSEKKALELPLSELIAQCYEGRDYEVKFLKRKDKDEDEDDAGGDITSQPGITPDNIERIITKLFVKSYMEKYKFYPKYITRVFHIMDLDGAFLDKSLIRAIRPEHVFIDRNGKIKTFYNTEEQIIETPDVKMIEDRNQRKCENIKYLTSLEKIRIDNKPVPYSAYYFSSNLDHFIHNNANLHFGKTEAAEAFAMNYVMNIDEFCKFFCNDPDSSQEADYFLSWELVKDSAYSIERHTNMNLLIDLIKNDGI